MKVYWTEIHDIIQETSDIHTYYLAPPSNFLWESGAHTHFALSGFNDGERPDKSLVRHMSISTMPKENIIGITTRIRPQKSRFKQLLEQATVGDSVALFKTGSRLPLYRDDVPLYFLSAGVGLATFRPLVLEYLANKEKIPYLHSLTIDSANQCLFPQIFTEKKERNFSHEYVASRSHYYERLKDIARVKNAYYYIIGSDEFLMQNLSLLTQSGVRAHQIILDKHEEKRQQFL